MIQWILDNWLLCFVVYTIIAIIALWGFSNLCKINSHYDRLMREYEEQMKKYWEERKNDSN